jgi:hypothetical protein
VAAIVIPAYEDHALKRPVAAALTYADETSNAVDRYFDSHRVLPQSLDDIKLVVPRPASIQNVVIVPRTGVLKVSLDIG